MNNLKITTARYLLTLAFIPLMHFSLLSQDSTSTKGESYFSISYLGNHFVNPGINVNWEQSLRSKIKVKEKKKRKTDSVYFKYKNKEFVQNAQVGFIFFPNNQGMFIAGYGINYRKTRNSRRRWQFGLGINYVGTVLPETYIFKEGKLVNERFLSGRSYFAPEINFGIGRKLKSSSRIHARHFNVRMLFLTNYNALFQPFVNIELGLTLKNKKNEKK